MSLFRGATLAALVCLPLAALAGKGDNTTIIQTMEGADAVRLVEESGHRTELKVDSVGDPLVNVWATDVNHGYQILFYDCTGGAACKSIQFRAWFKHLTDIPVNEVNEWNRTSRLGRAYLDSDRDPTIEHNVRLEGGITPAHLRAERDWFLVALAKYKESLGSRVEQ
jgi:hypothetical protein